ncbi:MAG TPA: patatin-like phospholipase family protein [Thermoanaerobaculia bacterium]|nr:patatin-like phospholipase family protein [Thermoanaerobaculia bacterium]
MPKLPLEVHEVLEEEYASMYGSIDRPPTGALYRDGDVIDEGWARAILQDCKIDPVNGLIAALNDLVVKGPMTKLCNSRALSDSGKSMIADYDEYTKGETDDRKQEINRRIIDAAFIGAVRQLRDIRLARLYAKLHAREDDNARTALSISGGGIRSATFALGVLQGLAGAGVLDKFDYLSTVSGGGYIGSWLSSWARRHKSGISGVQSDLVRADTAVAGVWPENEPKTTDGERETVVKSDLPLTKTDPEPQPVRHLREYSNYLSPQLGLTSGDTWTMASLYVRNLTLNLFVLVPLLAAALAIPRLFSLLLRHDALLEYRQLTLLTVMVAALAIGFGFLGMTRPTVHGRFAGAKFFRWISTNGGFLVCIFALVVAATAMSLYWAREASKIPLQLDWPWALGAIAATTVLPSVIYYLRYWRTTAVERHERMRRHSAWMKPAAEFAGAVLGVLTAAALLYLLAHKVFDNPLAEVPDLTSLPPFLRGLLSSVPVSELYVCFSVPLVLLVFFMQATVFVGISSKFNEDYDREWWGRAGAFLLMSAFFLAAGSAISVFGPVFLYRAPVILSSIGGLSGLIAGLAGFSAKTPASDKEKEKGKGSKTAAASGFLSALAVPLFVVVLLAAISLGTTALIQLIKGDKVPVMKAWSEQFQSTATYSQTSTTATGAKLETKYETDKTPYLSIATVEGIEHLKNVHATDWPILGCIAGVALVAFGLSFLIGVNRFSMHALYRNRIIRAYLGASRYHREPDAFTGFDPHDNLQMYELHPDLIWPTSFSDPAAFVVQLQNNAATAGVEREIWNALDNQTRVWIEDGHIVDAALTNCLIQDLNRILVEVKLKEPEGVDTPAARMRANRQALTDTFTTSLRPRQGAPLHVINTALNLTAGEKLAWQQRKAESFTVSPLHSGSFYVGYRNSREYGGTDGISLGTAVTISGAAASPNQGYHSSPAMAFLLTLLNVRLGSWLGNPGTAGKNSYDLAHPKSNLHPLALELTGMSNDQSSLVYLSDGGHFENLAIYEMVLRRCRYIVVSDGGCDPKFTFEDLGNAIRKIRTDLGVPIDIKQMFMFPRTPDSKFPEGRYVATAAIRYSAIDGNKTEKDGTLVYLKAGLYSETYFPKDVYNYATESADFPHETTADQFFSESQFESYRALGRHVVNEICGNYDEKSENPRAPFAVQFGTISAFAKAIAEKAGKFKGATA